LRRDPGLDATFKNPMIGSIGAASHQEATGARGGTFSVCRGAIKCAGIRVAGMASAPAQAGG
ncbi:MAG TPA: hypothetical protein VML55_16500, partial [Planctomycetaceae bacterium]|nr:hypothetical protein [Planctomycetaceae bacterium]